jgi:Ca2+-binding RTX toxin-like protein
MNQQDNHEANRADSLADLELTTQQADETRAGAIQRGGDGDDVLIGGFGNDWLSGGTGRDR